MVVAGVAAMFAVGKGAGVAEDAVVGGGKVSWVIFTASCVPACAFCNSRATCSGMSGLAFCARFCGGKLVSKIAVIRAETGVLPEGVKAAGAGGISGALASLASAASLGTAVPD